MSEDYNLFEKVKAAGIQYSNHESDLYIPVNEETKKLLADFPYKENVTTFRSNIDHKLWYDIPFAYRPWWEARNRS
jgi:hypothetical protein